MSIETFRHLELYCSLPPDTLLIRHFGGTEQLSQCFEYALRLFSLDHDLEMESLLGQHASVHVKRLGHERFFDGIVTEFSHAGTAGRYAQYQMTLRPWFWLLSQNRNCRVFQNESTLDIIKKVFSERGFPDVDESLLYTYRPREYCVQYRESELAFLSRLMEDEGIYYFFRHENRKHTLVLADSISAHEPAPGCETLRFGKLESEDEPPGVFFDWTTTKHVRTGAVALLDYDFLKPTAALEVRSQHPKPHAFASSESFDYPGGYTEVPLGESRARLRIEEHAVGYELAYGMTDCCSLGSGHLVALAEHPRRDQNKDYLIASASFDAESGAFETGDTSKRLLFTGRIIAIDKRVPYRPARGTPIPVIPGAQTATVVGPSGQEIWTDEHSRVKLQFHWDREGQRDENSSCWVRVAQGWAGSRWGSIHVPRIGHEVVVEFLEGDPDRPLVTGSVYNQRNQPPYPLPGEQTRSGIKTQSMKGGDASQYNELSFEDDRGHEQVYLQAQKDLDIQVKHAMTVTVDQSSYATTVALGSMTADVPSDLYRVSAKEILLDVNGFQVHMSSEGITLLVGASTIQITAELISLAAGTLKLNC